MPMVSFVGGSCITFAIPWRGVRPTLTTEGLSEYLLFPGTPGRVEKIQYFILLAN
jgi:hypothetical protein